VHVAEVEQRAVVKDRQIDGSPFTRVRGVHVAAEIAGPEAAERLFPLWRDRQAPEHRPERDLETLRRRIGKLQDPDVALAIDLPHEPPRGQRIVQNPRPRITGDCTDPSGVHRRHRRVAVHAQPDDFHDQRIVGCRPFDVERAYLTRPCAAGASVVVPVA
jgi:hypothetical protein